MNQYSKLQNHKKELRPFQILLLCWVEVFQEWLGIVGMLIPVTRFNVPMKREVPNNRAISYFSPYFNYFV